METGTGPKIGGSGGNEQIINSKILSKQKPLGQNPRGFCFILIVYNTSILNWTRARLFLYREEAVHKLYACRTIYLFDTTI